MHKFTVVVVAGTIFAAALAVASAADNHAYRAPVDLKPMLKIQWRLGPDYPMGVQEAAMECVGGKIVAAGGFSRHPLKVVAAHPDAFGGQPSGFTKLAFALDPAHEDLGWRRIVDMPGPARQGGAVAMVDGAMYVMGGINYDAPNAYRDTYRLQSRDGRWTWTKLDSCQLPWPLYGTASSTAVIGRKIYLHATADFFQPPGAEAVDFHNETGRDGSPVGKALLVLDTQDLAAGWKRLADCPGVPQFDAAFAAAGGKLWRLGGKYSPLDKTKIPADSQMPYYNAVDSWTYDPAADQWTRLPDMPDGSARRAVPYQDRYLIMIAGYKYPFTWRLDGTRTAAYNADEKKKDWKEFFESTVLVYDTKTRQLGTADPLIERTADPSATIIGDTIYTLGGEGGPRHWHPCTFQIGKIVGPSK